MRSFRRVGDHMYFVYVLYSKSRNKFYVGYTGDLEKRLKAHLNKSNHTSQRLGEIELVYYEASKDEIDARLRERQLKTGFGRGYLRKRVSSYLRSSNSGIAAIV